MTTQERSRSPLPPPSPPPSPPRQRHKHKQTHSTDPFLNLDNAAPTSPSPPSSPERSDSPAEQQDSLLTRIIISPLLMTSFLLSLFLVNHADRRQRVTSSSHTQSSSYLSYLWPSTYLHPEPYQDPKNSTWGRRDSTSSAPGAEPPGVLKGGNGNQRQESWHLRKKIRKVTRLEVSDALEMRGRVLVGLILGLLGALTAILYAAFWIVRKAWGY